MEEPGVVIETAGTTAKVMMSKAGTCESCGASGSCKVASGDRVMEADNPLGAKPGQQVMVDIESGAFLKATFLTYMLPVIFLFLGAYLGGKYGPALSGAISMDYWQALGGVVFLVLSAVLVRLYDRKVKRSTTIRPVIVKIMED
ncbi:MAG: SoxR reducing system RseC family protein [Nitrospirota bacterium]